MAPPAWALLERELLRENAAACQEFFDKYFDKRGYLQCVERWGGDDGPDDAIENLQRLAHPARARRLRQRPRDVQEGLGRPPAAVHGRPRRNDVPFARDGMYYKEFPVMFDWLHNGEGLTVFNLQGLSDPNDRAFQARASAASPASTSTKIPSAPNYDPQHKIIRSMFNGSRGPLLRKATALDWAGDPIEVEHRFQPAARRIATTSRCWSTSRSTTTSSATTRSTSKSTSLAFNAYCSRTRRSTRTGCSSTSTPGSTGWQHNGGIIPTNVGLDGTIGSGAGGKWYGGVYGWGFTVRNPVTGKLVQPQPAPSGLTGFGNAFLLTGDGKYSTPGGTRSTPSTPKAAASTAR